MSNKDQNSNHSWQQRLDELDSIPGEPMQDKKPVWEKLQVRLETRPARRKKFFYWAAAAAIILISLIPWIGSDEQADGIKQAQQNDSKNNPGSLTNKQQNNTTVESTAATITIQPKKIITATPATKKIKIIPVVEKGNQTVFENPNEKPTAQISIISSVPVVDTVKNIAVVAKKKLPVVHINELGNGNRLTTNNSALDNFKRFIRPSNKDVSIETPANSRFNGDHIIIKNVNPQNQN